MALTNLAIKNAKPTERQYKMGDEGGLYLLVKPTGGKLWRMDYRFAGKRKTAAFGKYPEVTLQEARARRDAARQALRGEVDPMHDSGAQRDFESVALRWHERQKVRWKKWYAERVLIRMRSDIFPAIGKTEIDQIEPPTILALVRKVERRGALDVAKRVRSHCSEVFQFGIAEGLCSRDPSADIKGALIVAPKVVHHRSVPWSQMGQFVEAMDSYAGDKLTIAALRFTIYTMVRTNETRFARWDEIDLSGEPIWKIPGARMKMGTPHLVPLSRQAQSILAEVRSYDLGGEFIFPSNTRSGVLSENTMLYAMYRMGYHGRATVHGFRSVASTYLNEREFNRDHIEAQLAHVEHDSVRAAYNSAQWLPQRREMLQAWADAVDLSVLG